MVGGPTEKREFAGTEPELTESSNGLLLLYLSSKSFCFGISFLRQGGMWRL